MPGSADAARLLDRAEMAALLEALDHPAASVRIAVFEALTGAAKGPLVDRVRASIEDSVASTPQAPVPVPTGRHRRVRRPLVIGVIAVVLVMLALLGYLAMRN